MHLDDTFRNNRLKRQNSLTIIFMNNFWSTDINFSNDQVFYIYFNRNRVHKHLYNINSNKASGPDGIHGKI